MWGCSVLPALCLPRCPPLRVWPSRFICANVWPQGLLVLRLPAPFVPHSASLGPATATIVLSTLVPVSAPPTGLDEGLFFISLVSDPLAVGFCVSSACARRCSVSTYAAILVLPNLGDFIQSQGREQHPCQLCTATNPSLIKKMWLINPLPTLAFSYSSSWIVLYKMA